jgi:hypothetical protein
LNSTALENLRDNPIKIFLTLGFALSGISTSPVSNASMALAICSGVSLCSKDSQILNFQLVGTFGFGT